MNFDAETLWSTNNANNFKGDGIYMNSVDESFSLGDSLWFNDGDGHLGNLSIEDTLTMGASGQITNENADYNINADGVNLQTTPGSRTEPRTLSFYNGSTLEAAIWAPSNVQLAIQAIGDNHDILIAADGDVNVQANALRLPIHDNESRPAVTTSDAGKMIYNTDDDRPQFVNNAGEWIGVAGN